MSSDDDLAEASRKRATQFAGNVLYFRCPSDKMGQLTQFGGKVKTDRTGSVCRGVWIFPSRKEAQLVLKNITPDSCPDVHVEEYSPTGKDVLFTKLRVTGIPATGNILDVAKLAPKADHITLRPATDCMSEEEGGKVAVVSFTNIEDCKETFLATEKAQIRGKPVCVFFERKKGDGKIGKKRKADGPTGKIVNKVVGFGKKGRGPRPRTLIE